MSTYKKILYPTLLLASILIIMYINTNGNIPIPFLILAVATVAMYAIHLVKTDRDDGPDKDNTKEKSRDDNDAKTFKD